MKKQIILVGLVFILLSSFAIAIDTDDAIFYHTFDDDDLSGTTFTDSTGNYDGTNTNMGTGTTGILGEAVSGANNAYMSFPSGIDDDMVSNEIFSMNIWIKADQLLDSSTGQIFYFVDDSVIGLHHTATSYPRFWLRQTGGSERWADSSEQTIVADNWKMITATTDGSTMKIYVDSVLKGTQTITSMTAVAGAGIIKLGSDNSNNWFHGDLDEFSGWDKTLTQTEINELYNSGNGYNPYAVVAPNYFQITAQNALNNETIDTFNATFTNSTTSFTNSTTDGILKSKIKDNSNYNIFVASENYANYYINLTNINNNDSKVVYLYPTNSININIYDQIEGNLINEAVTITFINDTGQFQKTTNNGTYFISDLVAGNWSIVFSSENYTSSTYSLSISDKSTQSLNAYMLSDESIEQTIFQTLDETSSQIIEGATITTSRIISDVWTIISVLQTDITGKTRLDYEEDEEYRFVISAEGYKDKSFSLDPILFSTYTIYLERETTTIITNDYSSINIYYTPTYFRDETIENITFTFASPTGNFEEYGFNATFDSTTITSSGNNAYGENLKNSINLAGAEFGDLLIIEYYYLTTEGVYKTFYYPYEISEFNQSNSTIAYKRNKQYGLGQFERTLIVVLSSVIMGGAGAMSLGAIAGSAMMLFTISFWIWKGFVDFWSFAITLIILFIFIIWRSAK